SGACGDASNGAAPVAGNDGGASAGETPFPGALPCAVDGVFAQRCRECHAATPLYGAPMPLITPADLHARAVSNSAERVYQRVGARIHDDTKPMPQPPNARLDAADAKTLDDWIARGAPAAADGDGCAAPPSDAGSSVDAYVPELGCNADEKLRGATAW